MYAEFSTHSCIKNATPKVPVHGKPWTKNVIFAIISMSDKPPPLQKADLNKNSLISSACHYFTQDHPSLVKKRHRRIYDGWDNVASERISILLFKLAKRGTKKHPKKSSIRMQ